MALPIFYSAELSQQHPFELDADNARHVTQVLRMKEGDAIGVTDGQGNYAECLIVGVSKKHCLIKANTIQHFESSKKNVTIAIGLLKNKARMEWFFEKATELGVNNFVPLITDRTERQNFRKDRMEAILISAMLQSQQYHLPKLSEPLAFEEFITSSFQQKLIAHCEEDEKQTIPSIEIQDDVCILIGPEGDFTSDEIMLAKQNAYVPVTLGKTRLRTETAGITAAVQLCV